TGHGRAPAVFVIGVTVPAELSRALVFDKEGLPRTLPDLGRADGVGPVVFELAPGRLRMPIERADGIKAGHRSISRMVRKTLSPSSGSGSSNDGRPIRSRMRMMARSIMFWATKRTAC